MVSGKTYVWDRGVVYAPDSPGVYALFDGDKRLLFVGGSENLRETFSGFFNSNFVGDVGRGGTRFYKREVVLDWKGRLRVLLDEVRGEFGLFGGEVSRELGFYFYEDVDRPVDGLAAFSLDDFWDVVLTVSVGSLEFHQGRGDFARWMRLVLEEEGLADEIENISEEGERLREEILNSLLKFIARKSNEKKENLSIKCPECDVKISKPKKTWTMAGRPNKKGERLQLQIGLFECPNHGVFRKALDKKWIPA